MNVLRIDGQGSSTMSFPHSSKLKVALLLAYCGAGYKGMQRNEGAKTIEGELQLALFKAGAISEWELHNPAHLQWKRAARTDKGVSAVAQVVSGKFNIDIPSFVEKVNSHLPKEIRLLSYTTVSDDFSAKHMCESRTYEYIIPAFAFDPSIYNGRVAKVLAGNEEAALLDTIKQARKNEPWPVKQFPHSRRYARKLAREKKENQISIQKRSKHADEGLHQISMDPVDAQPLTGSFELSSISVKTNKKLEKKFQQHEDSIYKFGDRERSCLNKILSEYIGTHNFHNFALHVNPIDPSALRTISSFQVSDVFFIHHMEFVQLTVVGRSFMLHQIRKMIGLAVAIMRGSAASALIKMALRSDAAIIIPPAPEIGLILDECEYTLYNKFVSVDNKVSFEELRKEIKDFKIKYIYSSIAFLESHTSCTATWLLSLNCRNYPSFSIKEE